jgi:tRNA dimethylallyltransferase
VRVLPISREELEHGRIDLTSRRESRPVLFIVGPTAAGKSRLTLALARRFNGEIINADSRQVYRHMNIGTAKPSTVEQTQVRHHLLDIFDPNENFDLASFLSLAHGSIRDIRDRDNVPIVVGGSGQYVWALVEGWRVPEVPPHPHFRRTKQEEAERNGPLSLYQQLQDADPKRAAQLDPRNLRRVIRALEVQHYGPCSDAAPQQKHRPLENRLIIGLTMDREALYRRIDDRVDQMLASGLVEEVRALAAKGYRLGQGSLSSPGYRELGQFLAGEISLDEALQRTKLQTHRLVRRQYSWFKLRDERINWLDGAATGLETQAADLVHDFLSSRSCYDTINSHFPEGTNR